MKRIFIVLAVFIFSIFSSVEVQALDLEKDQQIISALTSDEFVNELINYQFEGKNYPIRIIYNPKKQMLWGKKLSSPTSLSLIMIADVPIPLARRLEDLVLEILGSYEDSHFGLKDGKPKVGWNSVQPVYIAESIDDPINDEIIDSTFNSATFINKVIYYHVDKEYYRVRLLHNPEMRSFSETKTFQRESKGPSESYTITWNKKYAILVDKESPQKLIDRLQASLNHLSYWNWYFNFTLENGSYVTYEEKISGYNSTTTITYFPDTWFNYTESFF